MSSQGLYFFPYANKEVLTQKANFITSFVQKRGAK